MLHLVLFQTPTVVYITTLILLSNHERIDIIFWIISYLLLVTFHIIFMSNSNFKSSIYRMPIINHWTSARTHGYSIVYILPDVRCQDFLKKLHYYINSTHISSAMALQRWIKDLDNFEGNSDSEKYIKMAKVIKKKIFRKWKYPNILLRCPTQGI